MKAAYVVLALLWAACCFPAGAAEYNPESIAPFPVPLDSYQDSDISPVLEKLAERARQQPFNVVATVIFVCAIVHTFFAGKFMEKAHSFEQEHRKKLLQWRKNHPAESEHPREPVSFKATLFHFLGEVEAIFGVWLIPLILAIVLMYDWSHVVHYFNQVNYSEPLFVVIIMTMAATKPVIKLAETLSSQAARLGGSTTGAWWFSILTILPLLGSFITEPAAMTIAATLLALRFYRLKPSTTFMYATLGALFVNISIGGTLTHFAAPPVVMVAGKWDIGTLYMLQHIGWKAVLGILLINTLYAALFRQELGALDIKAVDQEQKETSGKAVVSLPYWVTGVHLAFIAWVVFNLHHPPLVLGGFLFFLAFVAATEHHQYQVSLRGPLLVGFFLAALVTHGGFQSWWLEPVLSGLGELPLFFGATILTAFNDNAAITYLASLVPAFDTSLATDTLRTQSLQYAVLTGAITGGGLTVIANAPNPAGQSILSRYFKGGISPLGLLAGALPATLIMIAVFLFFKTL